ncbi:MAG: transcriptional regulator NrdR [Acidobacteriota bacterium]|nr:transcriptional regulator NrdR [Acidobacteriota bacterium]
MKCPFCSHLGDKVVDSREGKDGESIRRRRECLQCKRRFTSYERIEEIQFMVIKKDGKRELFERQKALKGILASCQKRPVSMAECQDIVNDVLFKLYQKADREIQAEEIGEIIMDGLKKLDKVAYVRFASVYRDFQDASDFLGEVKPLIDGK